MQCVYSSALIAEPRRRFPKIVGNGSIARELALTARDFDADEALRIGFLSRVVDGGRDGVTQSAIELAEQIASKSPIAVIGTKVRHRAPAVRVDVCSI